MPIRINLLAEAQAAEELRRRDPVKRAIWVGAALVVVMLVWSSSLWVSTLSESARLSNVQARINTQTNAYYQVLTNQARLEDCNLKLAALNRVAVNRFLYGPLLDALQHSPVEGIQLTKLTAIQNFVQVSEIKQRMEGRRIIEAARPAGAVEKIQITLIAKDESPNPGVEQMNSFKEILKTNTYFLGQGVPTNAFLFKNTGSPQIDNESSKPFVLFTLECAYPDRTRNK